MKAFFFLYTILYILYGIILCKDCQNPIDCFAKAIDILNQDRAEMRRRIEDMQKRLDENNQLYEKLLNETRNDLNAKLERCQNNLMEVNLQLTNSINSVNSSIPRNIECSSVYTRGNYSSCPAGFRSVSCSCGSGCGSWDLNFETGTCHCGCGEWTNVQCCKIH